MEGKRLTGTPTRYRTLKLYIYRHMRHEQHSLSHLLQMPRNMAQNLPVSLDDYSTGAIHLRRNRRRAIAAVDAPRRIAVNRASSTGHAIRRESVPLKAQERRRHTSAPAPSWRDFASSPPPLHESGRYPHIAALHERSLVRPPISTVIAYRSAVEEPCTNACAGKARSRGTRCRDVIFETLFETLWVSNPIRPRSATSRNRVMRGPGVTQGAKRSQGVRRPRD